MYTDTITLFNRKEGAEGDTWYPSVIRNVDLNMDDAAIAAKYGAESSDRAILHVRYANDDGSAHIVQRGGTLAVFDASMSIFEQAGVVNADSIGMVVNDLESGVVEVQLHGDKQAKKLVGGKTWLPPKEWEKLEDQSKALTFTAGNRFDFFWLGDWGNEDPIHDSDFSGPGTLGFYQHMNKTHDYVFAITSVGGPYSIIPHFEIMGK